MIKRWGLGFISSPLKPLDSQNFVWTSLGLRHNAWARCRYRLVAAAQNRLVDLTKKSSWAIIGFFHIILWTVVLVTPDSTRVCDQQRQDAVRGAGFLDEMLEVLCLSPAAPPLTAHHGCWHLSHYFLLFSKLIHPVKRRRKEKANWSKCWISISSSQLGFLQLNALNV